MNGHGKNGQTGRPAEIAHTKRWQQSRRKSIDTGSSTSSRCMAVNTVGPCASRDVRIAPCTRPESGFMCCHDHELRGDGRGSCRFDGLPDFRPETTRDCGAAAAQGANLPCSSGSTKGLHLHPLALLILLLLLLLLRLLLLLLLHYYYYYYYYYYY